MVAVASWRRRRGEGLVFPPGLPVSKGSPMIWRTHRAPSPILALSRFYLQGGWFDHYYNGNYRCLKFKLTQWPSSVWWGQMIPRSIWSSRHENLPCSLPNFSFEQILSSGGVIWPLLKLQLSVPEVQINAMAVVSTIGWNDPLFQKTESAL